MDNLKPYQKRVIEEHTELGDKLNKLKAFIEANDEKGFKALSDEDKRLLNKQFDFMAEYDRILGERIARFS